MSLMKLGQRSGQSCLRIYMMCHRRPMMTKRDNAAHLNESEIQLGEQHLSVLVFVDRLGGADHNVDHKSLDP
jgi:hypothetical protein